MSEQQKQKIMKKLLFVIIAFSTINCIAQDNFKIDENNVIWQKIFETDKSVDEILKYFEGSMFFENYNIIDNTFNGILKPTKIDYKEFGFTDFQAPFYLTVYDYTPKVKIDVKNNKYRVTVYDIYMKNNGSNPSFSTNDSHFDKTVLNNKGKLKKLISKSIGAVDLTFDNIFTLKQPSLEDDW